MASDYVQKYSFLRLYFSKGSIYLELKLSTETELGTLFLLSQIHAMSLICIIIIPYLNLYFIFSHTNF